MRRFTFCEFFAGGGMARAGLGTGWDCVLANDFSPMKTSVYAANWGESHLKLGDVNDLTARDILDTVDLAWASFPCQDLSLAGNAAGLGSVEQQTRSGAFWAFWRIMQQLIDSGRKPRTIVLENVYGCLTSNEGRDFALICRCLALGGYRFGAAVIDAEKFVPQSRPRLFIVAVDYAIDVPSDIQGDTPDSSLHPAAMRKAVARLADVDQDQWFWLNVPAPPARQANLASIILDQPQDVSWDSSEQTAALLAKMAPASLAKLALMTGAGKPIVGTVYLRTRMDSVGVRKQRAELRVDGIAGCLRTPGGGSSRQRIVLVDGTFVRSRLMSAREAARLMGLPDSYKLPLRYNDAYHVCGDGVVVPVVAYLARNVIEPVVRRVANPSIAKAA